MPISFTPRAVEFFSPIRPLNSCHTFVFNMKFGCVAKFA